MWVKGKPPTLEELRKLVEESERSCRCDGGGTLCGACCAERTLRDLGTPERVLARQFTKLKLLPAPKNPWKEAVIARCSLHHIGWDESNPVGTLDRLLAYEAETALEPSVSKAAHDLLMTPPPRPILVSREMLSDLNSGEYRYDKNGMTWPYCDMCHIKECPWCYEDNWMDSPRAKLASAIRALVHDDLEELILEGELRHTNKRPRGKK